MLEVREIRQIAEIEAFQDDWNRLLDQTPGASFFQSPQWLSTYWRHFGADQTLHLLTVSSGGNLVGLVPLVVRKEQTKVGPMRVLTFPLHDWGSYYGPIGPEPAETLAVALAYLRRRTRDWDMLELRWQGGPGTDADGIQRAQLESGFHAAATLWDRTHVVDIAGTWDGYWSSRKGHWLRRFRHAERKLSQQGEVSYLRYRPRGAVFGDGSPRWDLYDACEQIAGHSWQGRATDGTTLTHEAIRGFLRDAHDAAAAAGAVDLNLLMIDGAPVAFVYGYHRAGYVYGLRRGYDANLCREGAGNILLARTLEDSFARGDFMYDMGVGSLDSKRHFQTRTLPILRFSHFANLPLRAQLLRAKRWWQSRQLRSSIAAGRSLDFSGRPAMG